MIQLISLLKRPRTGGSPYLNRRFEAVPSLALVIRQGELVLRLDVLAPYQICWNSLSTIEVEYAMDTAITEFDLKIRYQIYRSFAEECRALSYRELAEMFDVQEQVARQSLHRLHDHHMIFLELSTDAIRMANPFSAIPTRYKVKSGQKEWWANCAWDTLGIAAALNLDVTIQAVYPDTKDTIELQVINGTAHGENHIVYFPLPCRQWYDDLAFT